MGGQMFAFMLDVRTRTRTLSFSLTLARREEKCLCAQALQWTNFDGQLSAPHIADGSIYIFMIECTLSAAGEKADLGSIYIFMIECTLPAAGEKADLSSKWGIYVCPLASKHW